MSRQIQLNLYQGKRGGRRPLAGRKPIHSPGVAHRRREKVQSRFALHINFKVKASIRNKTCLGILKRAIRNARGHGLRVLHFSLQSNHVHLIVESGSNAILTRGMRSLTITFAKRISRGRIQAERYHLHVLRTLRETRNAVYYVLFNQQKHSGLKRAYVDRYSSLGTVRNLKGLARRSGMTIILKNPDALGALDRPLGWMINQVLSS